MVELRERSRAEKESAARIHRLSKPGKTYENGRNPRVRVQVFTEETIFVHVCYGPEVSIDGGLEWASM